MKTTSFNSAKNAGSIFSEGTRSLAGLLVTIVAVVVLMNTMFMGQYTHISVTTKAIIEAAK